MPRRCAGGIGGSLERGRELEDVAADRQAVLGSGDDQVEELERSAGRPSWTSRVRLPHWPLIQRATGALRRPGDERRRARAASSAAEPAVKTAGVAPSSRSRRPASGP